MKEIKLKQFTASILVVLSLLVSSVSACTCVHDSGQIEPGSSGAHSHTKPQQQHPHEVKTDSHQLHRETASGHQPDEQSKTGASVVFSENECRCADSAPEAFTKSETFKTEKQIAGFFSETQLEVSLTPQIISLRTGDFIKPFYLSDSFYNLAPGRAPPRL